MIFHIRLNKIKILRHIFYKEFGGLPLIDKFYWDVNQICMVYVGLCFR